MTTEIRLMALEWAKQQKEEHSHGVASGNRGGADFVKIQDRWDAIINSLTKSTKVKDARDIAAHIFAITTTVKVRGLKAVLDDIENLIIRAVTANKETK